MKVRVLLFVLMLALVVSAAMTQPAKAGGSSVDTHYAPSLAIGVTVRDPMSLEPKAFMVKATDNLTTTTQFMDWMVLTRDDGILVATLGGSAGDRNLKDDINGRLDLKVVGDKVSPPRAGDDWEGWLRCQVAEARARFMGVSRAYSAYGHFAPFITKDKGEVVLVIDLSGLLFGAHSIDFSLKQEGRYNALTGIAARSFYLASEVPIEVPNPELGCSQQPTSQSDETPDANRPSAKTRVRLDAKVRPLITPGRASGDLGSTQPAPASEVKSSVYSFSSPGSSSASPVRLAQAGGTSPADGYEDVILQPSDSNFETPAFYERLKPLVDRVGYKGVYIEPSIYSTLTGRVGEVVLFTTDGKELTTPDKLSMQIVKPDGLRWKFASQDVMKNGYFVFARQKMVGGAENPWLFDPGDIVEVTVGEHTYRQTVPPEGQALWWPIVAPVFTTPPQYAPAPTAAAAVPEIIPLLQAAIGYQGNPLERGTFDSRPNGKTLILFAVKDGKLVTPHMTSVHINGGGQQLAIDNAGRGYILFDDKQLPPGSTLEVDTEPVKMKIQIPPAGQGLWLPVIVR